MAEAGIYQRGQWKRENPVGTPDAAVNVFPGLGLDFDPRIPEFLIDAVGYDGPTEIVFGFEDSTVTGRMESADAQALRLIWSSYFGYVAPTTPPDAVLTRRDTHAPIMTAPPAIHGGYSLEVGASATTAASKASFVTCNSWQLTLSPERAAALSCAFVGQLQTDNTAINTTGVTEITQPVIGPRGVDVYLAATEAGLTTRIEPFSVVLRGTEKWGTVMKLNSTLTTWKNVVVRRHVISATIEIDRTDDAAANYMSALRAGSTRYLKVVAKGSQIESVGVGPTIYNNSATITMPFKFHDPGFGIVQDALSKRYTLTAIRDSAFTLNPGGRFHAVLDSTALTL